jgi:alpha-L-rhamnosidase
MKEHGMGPRGMNSFNHYAYGCVCEWIWETCAGISCDVSGAGFSHIVMKPVPDRRLGYVDAEYMTPRGLVRSSWKYKGDRWIWKFSLPEGVSATVTLPGETSSREYTSGTYTVKLDLNVSSSPVEG